MKQIYLQLVLVLAVFASCSKDAGKSIKLISPSNVLLHYQQTSTITAESATPINYVS